MGIKTVIEGDFNTKTGEGSRGTMEDNWKLIREAGSLRIRR